jgi:phage tail sheath protein FI
MPVTPTYPGVYVEEIPSGVRTITGVATSITAFIGRALRGPDCSSSGPDNVPVTINNFGDYERNFGGLWVDSPMSYAVRDFFLNGGGQAVIVRIHKNAAAAAIDLPTGAAAPNDKLPLIAASGGKWGNNLSATVDYKTKDATNPNPNQNLFNLTVQDTDPATQSVRASEKFLNISIDAADPRYIPRVLEESSALVRVKRDNTGASWIVPNTRPQAASTSATANSGSDGGDLTDAEYTSSENDKTGLFGLEKVDLFNLLCIPPATRDGTTSAAVYQAALPYCVKRRAMLVVDPAADWSVANAESKVEALGLSGPNARNAAVYFPLMKAADLLQDNQTLPFVPCGAIAGIMARTDNDRGVWKAPAGLDASINGIRALATTITDDENGQLNPLGINCLRSFPVYGRIVWGARTLRGADQLADEYKYIPVRRTALFIEESLYRGLKWVVFEPNDEPLWAQIRLNVGAFMHNLFRQGAFQGQTPREAYFVKCDSETTTQNDINLGIVNIVVGFAPLKPAEFVIIQLQQMAGQIEA